MFYFKPLLLSHCTPEYLAWLQDEQVTEFLEVDPDTISLASIESYVMSGLDASSTRLNLAFYSDRIHIGNASIFVSPTTPLGYFEFGWFIGRKDFWGGLTSASLMYIIFEIGFSVLRFKNCYGVVLKNHLHARIANKFVGFEEDSSYSYYSNRHCCYLDALNLSISSDNWNTRKSKLLSHNFSHFSSLSFDSYLLDFIQNHSLFQINNFLA